LEEAKNFIKNIPPNLLDEYKEIIFSEERIRQANLDLLTNIVFSIFFPSVAVYLAAITTGVDNVIGAFLIAAALTALFVIELLYLDSRKKRMKSIDKQRLFYFLENT
ncbi:hypothetical protein, partial [Streptococcus sp. DD11]|uniref:hypothetical protein n=1 Tax=Streptococcus sp. DD11 TaxID=1777879 RepID=UPI0013E2B1B9